MGKDHRTELAGIRKQEAENASRERTAKARRAEALRQKRLVSTRLKYFRCASAARAAAERLIGWRAGMVIVYIAICAVVTLFSEIVIGHALATCAFALTAASVVVALHYYPEDAGLLISTHRAEQECSGLTSIVEAQNVEIEHLKIIADALRAQQSAVGVLAFGVDPAELRRRRTSQMDNLASRLLFHSVAGLLLYLMLFVGFGLYLAKSYGHSEEEPTNQAAAEIFRRERGTQRQVQELRPRFLQRWSFCSDRRMGNELVGLPFRRRRYEMP